jgi:hypothetical protein
VSLHNELLIEARLRVAGPAPSQAALRRGVSDAYYPLFHAIGFEIARAYPSSVQAGAKRILDHVKAKKMAPWINGNRTLPALSRIAACPENLFPVAKNFCLLQEARHVADYDERQPLTKTEVEALIQRADLSLQALDVARDECPNELYAFVLSLVFDRWQK